MNNKDPQTPNKKFYDRVVYFEDEFHDRHVTIAILKTRESDFYLGMSICCSQDTEKKELGRHIAKGRAESAYDGTTNHSKACGIICATGTYSMHKVLREDNFFFKQIGRSFFYDFKSNPQKYIAGYGS